MSDRNSCLLNFLLAQASSDTDLECWLDLPALLFSSGTHGEGHAFEASDKHAVGESLGSS
jgi:hypothetical protein